MYDHSNYVPKFSKFISINFLFLFNFSQAFNYLLILKNLENEQINPKILTINVLYTNHDVINLHKNFHKFLSFISIFLKF